MYDLERTICDMVRSRSNIEIQDFSSALKAYISKKDKNLNLLMEYAALFRVQNVIRRYMEVLL
jgi:predicted CopG family antitoxin